MRSVVQPWVGEQTLMMQSVLFAAIRGPDGIHKNHISKKLSRWLRRCTLIAAFDGIVYPIPYDPADKDWRSGSFTGPSCYQVSVEPFTPYFSPDRIEAEAFSSWQEAMDAIVRRYMLTLDEVPHHFQLHFMHAAEIIGYKHPSKEIADWWLRTYKALANDMHLNSETEEQLDFRLGDKEAQWRQKEEVTAD